MYLVDPNSKNEHKKATARLVIWRWLELVLFLEDS